MLVLRLLNEAPLWLIVLAVVGAAELYTVGLMLLTRRIWGESRLELNNEVAGFKYAVIGVLYAVLLGFVVIAVWDNFQDTDAAVRNEAKALRDLTEISYALPKDEGKALRAPIREYAETVVKSEWPAMARGQASPAASDALAHVAKAILDISAKDLYSAALFRESLKLIAQVDDNRNERLDSANGSVPPILWLALVMGALIALGYPAFFATPNLGAQLAMTASIAALVALAFLPAVVLDYPFTGEVSLSPEPFIHAMKPIPPHLEGLRLDPYTKPRP